MSIDTHWLRAKRFDGSVAWVLSLGRRDGRRLTVSWHRVPAVVIPSEEVDW